jgi:hypothetical protein
MSRSISKRHATHAAATNSGVETPARHRHYRHYMPNAA